MSDPSGLGWEERWERGNTVWHQSNGNKMLRQWWGLPSHKQRVLVPLCGKSLDLLWLEERGHHVTGVELSAIAVQAFFADHDLAYTRTPAGELERYDAQSRNLSLYCGDYFQFTESAFDAVYDRAALIAMPPQLRSQYAAKTSELMRDDAGHMLITFSYDQSVIAGPPFSVPDDEVLSYWSDLPAVHSFEALDHSPPKFKEAGLTSVMEKIWYTPGG